MITSMRCGAHVRAQPRRGPSTSMSSRLRINRCASKVRDLPPTTRRRACSSQKSRPSPEAWRASPLLESRRRLDEHALRCGFRRRKLSRFWAYGQSLRGQYGENDEEGFGQEGDANKGHEIVPCTGGADRARGAADPDLKHVGLTTYDAKDPNTKYPPITTLRPPMGAPNVMIVLIDDVGFGASSAFGGPCKTPVAEKLAANGLKLNRFHTTALCSPTRQAMLTGRNHHSVGMGAITEMATSAPGNNSIRPKERRPSPKPFGSTGIPPRSSVSATRCRCGRSRRWARSTSGRPVRDSNISTASWVARPTSTTRACTRALRPSIHPRARRTATR